MHGLRVGGSSEDPQPGNEQPDKGSTPGHHQKNDTRRTAMEQGERALLADALVVRGLELLALGVQSPVLLGDSLAGFDAYLRRAEGGRDLLGGLAKLARRQQIVARGSVCGSRTGDRNCHGGCEKQRAETDRTHGSTLGRRAAECQRAIAPMDGAIGIAISRSPRASAW
jgi:hypothetical protein